MKRVLTIVAAVVLLVFSLESCTPLLVGGAAAGGAYVGYTLARKGYTIQITKPVKGKKIDNSTRSK